MAYHIEKTAVGNEIVIDGFTNGIQASPHSGIADLKNLNINSFTGEASVNYNRVNMLPVVSGGVMSGTPSSPAPRYTYGSNPKLVIGSCIVPRTGSTITGFSDNKPYWVTAILSDSGGTQQVSIANQYGVAAQSTTENGGETATFDTFPTHKFIQGATEYDEANNAYIYYLCDSSGVVWVNNPAVYGVFSPAGDTNGVAVVSNVTGFGVSQGAAFILSADGIYTNFTKTIAVFSRDTARNQGWHKNYLINTPSTNTTASHYVLKVPDQNGSLYYCDSQFVGQITGLSEKFCLMTVTSSGTATQAITTYNQGVVPTIPLAGLPVTVVAKVGGSIPAELTATTQYYVKNGSYSQANATLQLATTPTGSAISVSVGSFYVTTFDPSQVLMTSNVLQALALSYDDITTCLGYISQGGLTLAIGTNNNNVYFWTPGTSAPSSVIPLPENNTHRLLNVDNSIYIFAGNKGNIYIANGSALAGAITIPDYVADQYGANQNPWFVWGDAIFLRGRVFFSIQDQNAGNTTGNCGGIWSFTPTQNLFLGQDQGVQLHLEHQNSYGTYNGVCDVLLAPQNQQVNGAQYWSGWSSDYSSPTFGIDQPGTVPYTATSSTTGTAQWGQIDTDIIPVGTFLAPYTPSNVEYKLSRPLVSGETVEIQARPNLTATFISLGTDNVVAHTAFEFPTVLQNNQWLQFRVKLTSTTSSPSFLPISELRIRP